MAELFSNFYSVKHALVMQRFGTSHESISLYSHTSLGNVQTKKIQVTCRIFQCIMSLRLVHAEGSKRLKPLLLLKLCIKTFLPLKSHLKGFEKSSPQPGIKVHIEIHSNFRSVLLDFQSFTEKKTVFECHFAHPMDIIFIIPG